MQRRSGQFARNLIAAVILSVLLAACGGGGSGTDSHETVSLDAEGETPFVYYLSVVGPHLENISSISVKVNTKSGHVSKPILFTYSLDYLRRNGFLTGQKLIVPVVGLYEDYNNQVQVSVRYPAVANLHDLAVPTKRFLSSDGKEYRPELIKRIDPGHSLDFNFFYVKRLRGGPLVYDLDGEIRWTSNAVPNAYSVTFSNGTFIVGDQNSPKISSLDFTGRVVTSMINSPGYEKFHHDVAAGKSGFLAEMDTVENGIKNIESVLAEVSANGFILKQWDLAKIISAHMSANGDSPADFVRYGIDWFHMNSAIYSRLDNSLLISSRENFVIKLNYDTGDIIWIFGDPTKYWYSFPSLRQKAIMIDDPEMYPVGQHSLSIDSAGNVLLFDNGGWSFNQPPGQSRGISKSFSAPRKYRIDEQAKTATSIFSFENGRTILSDICSSVYETTEGSMLINYSVSDAGYLSGNLTPRLLGISKDQTVQFEFRLTDTDYCEKSWNADIINLQNVEYLS